MTTNSDGFAGRIFREPTAVQSSDSVLQDVTCGAERVWREVRESCLKDLQDNRNPTPAKNMFNYCFLDF